MPRNPPLNPDIIERAPIDAGSQSTAGLVADQAQVEANYLEIIGELSAQLESAETERDRLAGELDIDQVKARLLRPYVNRVFWFVVFYCAFVGITILLKGWSLLGFDISDTVLGIISGSTAVAVIGLIGMVITGLFSAPTSKS